MRSQAAINRTRKRLRSANRVTSPTLVVTRAATAGPTLWRSVRWDLRAWTIALSSAAAFFIMTSTATKPGQLFRGDPPAGAARDGARADTRQHRLGLDGGEVACRLPGKQYSQQGL